MDGGAGDERMESGAGAPFVIDIPKEQADAMLEYVKSLPAAADDVVGHMFSRGGAAAGLAGGRVQGATGCVIYITGNFADLGCFCTDGIA